MFKCYICLFKPKIKPIVEISELDILENKIRLSNEYVIIISDSFKEKLKENKKKKLIDKIIFF